MMFITDRFMASAISLVRIAPEAPTSAPAMMRTGLSSTKPAIATAVPVNEFSRLMTTGMSAPPMGSVIVTPKTSAARRMSPMTGTLRLPAHRKSAPTTTISASAAVTMRPPGIMTGRDGVMLRPISLPDAISEPVKVMLPMTMSRTVATLTWSDGALCRPR